MPASSMVNMRLLIGRRQSDIWKRQHVNNFLNKFCTNTLFPPNGNVALLNNWETVFISGTFSWDPRELGGWQPLGNLCNWYFTQVAWLVFRWALSTWHFSAAPKHSSPVLARLPEQCPTLVKALVVASAVPRINLSNELFWKWGQDYREHSKSRKQTLPAGKPDFNSSTRSFPPDIAVNGPWAPPGVVQERKKDFCNLVEDKNLVPAWTVSSCWGFLFICQLNFKRDNTKYIKCKVVLFCLGTIPRDSWGLLFKAREVVIPGSAWSRHWTWAPTFAPALWAISPTCHLFFFAKR